MNFNESLIKLFKNLSKKYHLKTFSIVDSKYQLVEKYNDEDLYTHSLGELRAVTSIDFAIA